MRFGRNGKGKERGKDGSGRFSEQAREPLLSETSSLFSVSGYGATDSALDQKTSEFPVEDGSEPPSDAESEVLRDARLTIAHAESLQREVRAFVGGGNIQGVEDPILLDNFSVAGYSSLPSSPRELLNPSYFERYRDARKAHARAVSIGKALRDGVLLGFPITWALVYYALLLHDSLTNDPPYLNTPSSILENTSQNYNHASFASNFGSDLPHESLFLFSTIVVGGSPAIVAFLNGVRHELLCGYPKELSFFIESRINQYVTHWEMLWREPNATRIPKALLTGFSTLLMSGVSLFPTGQYVHFLVRRTMELLDFHYQKTACEARSLTWSFVELIGNYDCVIARGIYYPFAKQAQATLDAFLSIPQPPRQILSLLRRLAETHVMEVGAITRFDLSKQAWPEWSDSDWDQLMSALELPRFSSIEIYNVSTAIPMDVDVSVEKLDRLGALLKTHAPQLKEFDIHHRRIGEAVGLAAFLTRNHTHLQTLYFSGTGMENLFLMALARQLSNTTVTTLLLSDNAFDGDGLMALREALPFSNVTTIDLSGNTALVAEDVTRFTEMLNNTAVTAIEYSGVDLFELDPMRFGSAVSRSSLQTLRLRNTGLTDEILLGMLPFLQNATIETIDFSQNTGITDLSAVSLFEENFPWRAIGLGETGIFDETLSAIVQSNTSTLQYLDLNGNAFTVEATQGFWQHLPPALQTFYFQGNDLSDTDTVEAVIAALNQSHPLTDLDLSATGLTPINANRFLSQVPFFGLNTLRFNDNELSESGASLLALFTNGVLRHLQINRGGLSSETLTALLRVLPQSSLVSLEAQDNAPLAPDGIFAFAEGLVTGFSPYMHESLTDLSVDGHRVVDRFAYSVVKNITAVHVVNAAQLFLPEFEGAFRALCHAWYKTPLSLPQFQFLPTNASTRMGDLGCPWLTVPSSDSLNAFSAVSATPEAENPTHFASSTDAALTNVSALLLFVVCQRFLYSTFKTRGFSTARASSLSMSLALACCCLSLCVDNPMLVMGVLSLLGVGAMVSKKSVSTAGFFDGKNNTDIQAKTELEKNSRSRHNVFKP